MEKIITSREEIQNISPLLKGIMEFAFDEPCIMDADGYILHCSESSPLIWGRPNSESIGRHIAELDSASPYPELLATGKPILGKLHIINGMTCITHMIPLFDREEKIIGAFGVIVFRGMEKLKRLMRDQSFDPDDADSQKLYHQLARAEASYSLADFVGATQEVRRIKEMCRRFAREDYPVLIRGKTAFRRCESGGRTSHCWSGIFSASWAASGPFPQRRWSCWRPLTGRETSGSCATW